MTTDDADPEICLEESFCNMISMIVDGVGGHQTWPNGRPRAQKSVLRLRADLAAALRDFHPKTFTFVILLHLFSHGCPGDCEYLCNVLLVMFVFHF